jgi:Mn-dependent DtxR family transcriptional regulator
VHIYGVTHTDKPPVNTAVTEPQHKALRYISGHIRAKKISPSLDEIAAALGVQKASARQFVERLRRKGMLTAAPGRYRNLMLTLRGSRIANKPFQPKQ